MYLIVFATSFIRLIVQFQQKVEQLNTLKNKQKKNEQKALTVRVDRKTQVIQLNDILYIESLNDFVKIVTVSDETSTREKISKLYERLPEYFIRIHRSFVINTLHLQSFNHTEIQIQDKVLPVSRSYKKEALQYFRSISAESWPNFF